MAITLTTQWGTLKYQKPIALSIASLIFLSGINILNGNLLYLIVYLFTKDQSSQLCDNPWYIYLVGFTLIAVSLLLFYLLITNWRIEVYSKLYYHLQKVTNTYGTAHRTRLSTYDETKLRPLHAKSYQNYLKAKTFLDENSASLDPEVDEKFGELLLKIAKLIIDLDYYIKKANQHTKDYDPVAVNKIADKDFEEVMDGYKNLKTIVRKKEKFKL